MSGSVRLILPNTLTETTPVERRCTSSERRRRSALSYQVRDNEADVRHERAMAVRFLTIVHAGSKAERSTPGQTPPRHVGRPPLLPRCLPLQNPGAMPGQGRADICRIIATRSPVPTKSPKRSTRKRRVGRRRATLPKPFIEE